MYIPMNEKETRYFKLPEPLDVELLVKPFTGENETFYDECFVSIQGTEDTKVKTKFGKVIFDYFVKGFIHPETGEKVEFSEDKKASSYFNVIFIATFLRNIDKINTLTIEEKKT